jgi:hypothetical protein
MFQLEHWRVFGAFVGGDDRRLLPRFTTFKQSEAIYEDWVV